jgi:predicted nuclease of predicted toxin-antitoxin system
LKLLVDMNLSPHWIGYLKSAGLAAVHWTAIGRSDAPDAEIMAYAAEHDYVGVTHDLDFSAILAATRGTKNPEQQILFYRMSRLDDLSRIENWERSTSLSSGSLTKS